MEFNTRTTNKGSFAIRDYQDLPAQMRSVVSQIEGYSVEFLYDGAIKLVERMRKLEQLGKIYPLIAMTGWTETEETKTHLSVTLNQLIIASLTDKDYYSEKRDEFNFKPVLLPVQNEFEYRLINCGYYIFGDSCDGIEFASRRREMFFGDNTEHEGASPIDAIVYEGIDLTINKSLTI
jgi:hypothetical protein